MTENAFEHYSHTSGTSSFEVPEGTVFIGENAFSEGKYLYSISLPDTVKVIGKNAFTGCTRLRSIRLPENLEVIGEGAFQGCSHLDTPLPSGVREIGKYAFCDCWELRSAVLENVGNIGECAFMRCTHLKSVSISGECLAIGQDAFNQCISLSSAKICTDSRFFADRLFTGCSALKEVTLPASTVSIRECFEGCSTLREFDLPPLISTFDTEDLKDCGLKVLRLHSAVRSISLHSESVLQCLEVIEVHGDNPFFRCQDGILLERDSGRAVMCPAGAQSLRLKRQAIPGLEKAAADCRKLRKLVIVDGKNSLELNLARGFRPELIPAIVAGDYRNIRSSAVKIPLMIFDLECHSSAEAKKIIRKDISKVMKFLIAEGNVSRLEILLKHDLIPPERIDEFIAMASGNNCGEIALALLDHKNSGGGYTDIMNQFSL